MQCVVRTFLIVVFIFSSVGLISAKSVDPVERDGVTHNGQEQNKLVSESKSDRNAGEFLPISSQTFWLTFSGFSVDEMKAVEDYLVVFSGYVRHSIESSGLRRHEYTYVTSASDTELNRSLHFMLEFLGFEGRVAYTSHVFSVDKFSRPISSEWTHPLNTVNRFD